MMYSKLFDIPHLFANILQTIFHADNLMIDFCHDAFASDGVYLAVHLLTEEIETFTDRIGRVKQIHIELDMGLQTDKLLTYRILCQEYGDLLEEPILIVPLRSEQLLEPSEQIRLEPLLQCIGISSDRIQPGQEGISQLFQMHLGRISLPLLRYLEITQCHLKQLEQWLFIPRDIGISH